MAHVKKLSSSSKVHTGFSKSSSEGTQTYTYADLKSSNIYCCLVNFHRQNPVIGIHTIKNFAQGEKISLRRLHINFKVTSVCATLLTKNSGPIFCPQKFAPCVDSSKSAMLTHTHTHTNAYMLT